MTEAELLELDRLVSGFWNLTGFIAAGVVLLAAGAGIWGIFADKPTRGNDNG